MSVSNVRWEKIGPYIEQSYIKNTEGLYGESDAVGVNIDKEILPMRGNISEKDFTTFYLVPPKHFAYNPRGSRKLGLGYNATPNTYIITFNDVVFRIKPTAEDIIVPEYLFLYLSRKEWDRKAEFLSWGSSTEVFSWETLCEVEIPLPDITVQQDLVDTYNGLKALAEQNEALIEPLSKACEAFIVDCKNKYPEVELGDNYIELCDERNSKGIYTLDDVRGISIQKKLIFTKADMKDVVLTPYKLLKPREFSYVTVTSRNGGKISLAMNDADETYIVSSSYVNFRCKDTEELLPEYLYLLLSRSEFDRYSRFNSWGSARETFDWEEMCRVKIPLPKDDIQRSVVNLYKCLEEAKRIASEAREKLKTLCPALVQRAANS